MTPLSDTEASQSIPLPHDTDTWGKTPAMSPPNGTGLPIALAFGGGVVALCILAVWACIYFH